MANEAKKNSITIDVQRGVLKAVATYENDGETKTIPIDKVDNVNAILSIIYDKEDKNLSELIDEHRVFVTPKVANYYGIVDDKFFSKIAVDTKQSEKSEKKPTKKGQPKPEPEKKPESEKKPEPEKASSDDDDEEKKGGIKFRNFAIKVGAGLLIGTLLILGVREICKQIMKNSGKSDTKNYHVDINDDGEEYSYNMTDEEALMEAKNAPVELNDYKALGSIVEYDDMNTQLAVIDDLTFRDELFEFQNLVVDDDKDAIGILNGLRNQIFEGTLSKEDFMRIIVDYVFNNNRHICGKFIEEYNNLHPFGQYIVIRMSQGILQDCRGYNDGMYNFNTLVTLYDVYGDEAYRKLMNEYKIK